MSTPTHPRYAEHRVALEIIRRRSVYRRGVDAEEIQRHLQWLIEAMLADGYAPEVIHSMLSQAAQFTVREATENNCNVHRARLFEELISLELMQ